MTYSRHYRTKFIGSNAKNPAAFQAALGEAADEIGRMVADGVTFDFTAAEDDYVTITTDDEKLAQKYGMYPN